MRSMSAPEAALNFSAVLDAVESGETIVVTRDGSPVAKLTPERTRVVDHLAEIIEKHPLPPDAVDELEDAIRDLREWQDDREREWPD